MKADREVIRTKPASIRRRTRWAAPTAIGLAALVLAAPAAQADDAGLKRSLDRALDAAGSETQAVGLQAAAIRDGEVIWTGAAGDAVVSPARPVDQETVFGYASLGKLLLSTLALRQVEQGVLDLGVPIARYAPEVPGSDRVTLRNLLNHTAGYPDYFAAPEIAPLFGDQYDPYRRYSARQIIAAIGDPQDPQTKFEYSNSGYLILAYVVRRALHRSLPRTFSKLVAPIGMTRKPSARFTTMRHSLATSRVMAHGYQGPVGYRPDQTQVQEGLFEYWGPEERAPTDTFGLPWGDGAFAGTALGAATVLDALFVRRTLLRRDTVREMVRAEGNDFGYGLGTHRQRVAGTWWQGHGGLYGGYSSMGYASRELGLTIVVLANKERLDGGPQVAPEVWSGLASAATGRPARSAASRSAPRRPTAPAHRSR